MGKYLAIIICAAISAYVGLHGYINSDSGWLISATERWLGGERLYVDVVETNPPLVIYLTAIPLLLGQKFGFGAIESFVIFVVVLSAISAAISVSVTENKWLKYWLIFALILLPAANFGQREHLFLLFFIPYFLQLLHQKKPSVILAIFAAIGLALKPYFLIFWVFAVLFSKVKIFDITNFVIGILLAGYAAFVYFYVPEYMELLPMLLKYYGNFRLLDNTIFIAIATMTVLYFVPIGIVLVKYRDRIDYKLRLISLSFLAGIIYTSVQFKGWSNHQLPGDFFGTLMCVGIITVLRTIRSELWARTSILISLIILIMQLGGAIYANNYLSSKNNYKDTQSLVSIIEMYASDSYVCEIGFNLTELYPALNYTSAKSCLRYGNLWMLPGIYEKMSVQNGVVKFNAEGKRSEDEILLIAQIIGDIAKKPPKLMMISNRRFINNAGQKFRFDFLAYLSQQPDFVKIFSNYKKLSEVSSISIYVYDPS